MVNIAIDARFYGTGHTGLGRYTTNVLKYLPSHLRGLTLKVLLRDAEYDNFPGGENIEKIHAEIPHYSLAEQTKLPKILKQIGADLLYTLHFNAPIFSGVPTIITVHDLIKSHFTTSDTTTRSPWLYALKRAGYNRVIQQSLSHASDIIVPTITVKNDILAMFSGMKPERIHAITEAPDEIFRSSKTTLNLKNLPQNYILFVGNVYPHKNLPVLLEALKSFSDLDLVIVTKPSLFLSRVLAPYDQGHIHVLSDLTDSQLVEVYQRAKLLVTPSLMEGYGLVGLESLMVGTPVIASNIPVYREVYGDKVTYFDPHSAADLVTKIKQYSQLPHYPITSLPVLNRTWDDVARDISEVIHARSTSL
ncbi:MAG: glycosyltransferase family 1 protein [Microgenomates group bacterium]